MEGMVLIKFIEEKDGITISSVLFIEYNLIRINTIKYIWKNYLKFKSIGLIITPTFIIIGITFCTTNNLWSMSV